MLALREDFTKVLTADKTAISSNTTVATVGLPVSIASGAAQFLLLRYLLIVSAANTTMDLKLGFVTRPTGTSAWFGAIDRHWGSVGTAATTGPPNAESANPVVGTVAGTFGVEVAVVASGFTASGTLDLGYAQNTSDAGNLQILKGSCVEVIHLG
jgi:hypothetical protein